MSPEKENDLRALFNSYDENGDGVISADELKHAFGKLGQTISDEEIQNMVSFVCYVLLMKLVYFKEYFVVDEAS